VVHANPRRLGSAGHHVVCERRCKRLAQGVVSGLLIERSADALHDPADRLALDHHGIDHHPAVFNGHIIEDLDRAGVGVDRDHRCMTGVGKTPSIDFRTIPDRHLES
jgi:hypothetical protein